MPTGPVFRRAKNIGLKWDKHNFFTKVVRSWHKFWVNKLAGVQLKLLETLSAVQKCLVNTTSGYTYKENMVSKNIQIWCGYQIFLMLYGCPSPTLRHRGHLSPDVNHCIVQFWPGGHQEPRNEVGSWNPAERLARIVPEPSDSITKP